METLISLWIGEPFFRLPPLHDRILSSNSEQCQLPSSRSATWRPARRSTRSESAWSRSEPRCWTRMVWLCLQFSSIGCFGGFGSNRWIVSVADYARSQGKTPLTFGPTDLVCCRTLQGHTGKVLLTHTCTCFVCFNCMNELFWEHISMGWMNNLESVVRNVLLRVPG